jgi:sulfopyruvate decarboxylase TPP-binding subunit
MQYTGFLDSVNAIRGAAVEYHRPVCMVVGLLGKEADREAAASAVYGVKLTVDVVAAMGIDTVFIEEPVDVGRLAPAIERAYDTSRPMVALVGRRVEA